LDGTVAGETLLGPTCEKFLRGIRKRLGNWGAGRVCGWGIRPVAGQRDCRAKSGGRTSD